MYCPNCKQNIPDTTGFCPHCGTPVQVSSNANMNGGPQYQQVNYDYDYDAVPEDFNLFSAYASMFKKYAKFKGRSRRKEYWLAWLMNMIITLVMLLPIITLLFFLPENRHKKAYLYHNRYRYARYKQFRPMK